MSAAWYESDLNRLVTLLNTLERGGLAIALCEDRKLRDAIMNDLRPRLTRRLHEFQHPLLGGDAPYEQDEEPKIGQSVSLQVFASPSVLCRLGSRGVCPDINRAGDVVNCFPVDLCNGPIQVCQVLRHENEGVQSRGKQAECQ